VQHNRSLFSLITFCAGTSLLAGFGLGVIYAAVTVAFGVGQTIATAANAGVGSPSTPPSPLLLRSTEEVSSARLGSFSGLITDDRCGARHDMGSALSSSECTRICVRNGAGYILVSGDKKYVLAGGVDELAKLSGQRATVTGTLSRNTITVSSVTSEQELSTGRTTRALDPSQPQP